MPKLTDMIAQARKRDGGYAKLSQQTGIQDTMLAGIAGGKHGKHRKNTLDILYAHFKIPKDQWYLDNMKKWVKPTESVLGEVFRKKRLAMGLSISDVTKRTKIGTRQIARLEAGDSLPSFASYTIIELMRLYPFTEGEKQTVRWYIVLLRDLVNVNNSME